MVNGHPNFIKMCSYINLVKTIIMLVQNARASTHVVAYPVATKMYCLHDNLLASFISPIKSNPHFCNGYSGNVVTSLAKFWFNRLLIL
jgi:hypothetical protein